MTGWPLQPLWAFPVPARPPPVHPASRPAAQAPQRPERPTADGSRRAVVVRVEFMLRSSLVDKKYGEFIVKLSIDLSNMKKYGEYWRM